MNTYRRKAAYQSDGVVEEYVHKFTDPIGRKEHDDTTEALTRALHSIPGVRIILDMPCGTGRYSSFLCKKGYLYVGADISMKMMEVLVEDQKEQGSTLPLVRCDAEHLPFRNEAFDCVVCVRFLNHHIPSLIRRRMLREMGRVSRKWLIVQSHRLKAMGPFTLLKVFMRGLFGGEINKYLIRREILQEGWEETGKVPIQDKRFFIGIYQKTQEI